MTLNMGASLEFAEDTPFALAMADIPSSGSLVSFKRYSK
jgi:hypothetical protein